MSQACSKPVPAPRTRSDAIRADVNSLAHLRPGKLGVQEGKAAKNQRAAQFVVEAPFVRGDGQVELTLGLVDRLLLVLRVIGAAATTTVSLALGSGHSGRQVLDASVFFGGVLTIFAHFFL